MCGVFLWPESVIAVQRSILPAFAIGARRGCRSCGFESPATSKHVRLGIAFLIVQGYRSSADNRCHPAHKLACKSCRTPRGVSIIVLTAAGYKRRAPLSIYLDSGGAGCDNRMRYGCRTCAGSTRRHADLGRFVIVGLAGSVPRSALLVPQGHHWVHLRRAARGNVASDQRHGSQDE